ncbi:MAG TPA: VOC family protein [Ktedonobacterales bacterium]|jgi:predicted enzyme related to lactoylglutathione lyase
MERVTGIGGFFFRARDPQALKAWYQQHLGMFQDGAGNEDEPWLQEAGPTAFQPFPADTEYFERPEQMWMLNLRVRDLDAMVAQLREAGIEVKVDPENYPYGRFARTHDPEGNPIELWQPLEDADTQQPAGE